MTRPPRSSSTAPRRWGPARQAIVAYRFGVWRGRLRRGFLRKLLRLPYVGLHRSIRNRHGIEIHYTATIGDRVLLSDHGDIVIGNGVVIGDDCVIEHGVTLGKTLPDAVGWPVVGDRVTIGPGAVVVGAIRVGDDAVIGPNCVVMTNVPEGALVWPRPSETGPATPGPGVRTVAGARVTLFGDVSLGARSLLHDRVTVGWEPPARARGRIPADLPPPGRTLIGSGAELGAGAVIVSGVSVGDGASVGPNAVVTADVPSGASVHAPAARTLRPLRTTDPRSATPHQEGPTDGRTARAAAANP